MKRSSPLRRTPFRREGPSSDRLEHPRTKEAQPKRCCICRRAFTPRNSMAMVCSGDCAARYAARQREAKEKAERTQDREKREAMKGLRELIAEAQAAFNEFIRLRDADQPCIDCGKPFEPNRPGGSMDAGHYLARSVAPQHRFNEDNCFGQRKNCNRPGGATRGAFRAGVEQRIGIARLVALEGDTSVRKWSRDELRGIRDDYRAKVRQMKATNAKGA